MRRLAAGTAVPDDCRLNPRRLVRACEVLELTGQVPWLQRQRRDEPDARFAQFCLVPPLGALRERIRARTRRMLAAGWLSEAAEAERLGLLTSPTARQALGYAEAIAFVHQEPPKSEEALAETIANRTIQYARRQLTWFRHQHPGAVLLDPSTVSADPAGWICRQVLQTCQYR